MAASSESGGVFPVDVLDFPFFHPSPLRWDLAPAWLWPQFLWLSPLPVPDAWEGAGHSRTMSPFSPCPGLDPARDGLICCSPGDGCMDWAVPFLNPPLACTVGWWGTVQHPHWC